MKMVLVVGASSVVGHFLIPRLIQAGFEVHALSRQTAIHPNVHWHQRDVQAVDWHRGLPLFDAAFHLAPLWLLPHALNQLQVLGVRRLIAFSSTSALTKVGSTSPRERALAETLLEAEARIARECGFAAWTIFRPTLIYGAGKDQNVTAIARFVRRFGFFPIAGQGRGLRQPVHADDLALACLLALRVEAAEGRIFNLGGGEVFPYREMVERIFHALDRPARVLSLPEGALRVGVATVARLPRFSHLDAALVTRMAQDMSFDVLPARRAFGYSPRIFMPRRVDLGVSS